MLRRLKTYEDEAAYKRWLETRSTTWLLAFKARLEDHKDYYFDPGVTHRLSVVKDVLWVRTRDKEEA